MTSSTEDRIFELGMWWRIVYGTFRIIFGLALLRVVGASLTDFMLRVMSHELIQDRSDWLYHFAVHHISRHDLYVTYFLAAYFIFWGAVDVLLSINLLRGKLWAFPVSLWLIAGFVCYGLFRLTHTHSLILLCIIIFDITIFWFIEREYQKLRKERKRILQ
ncbi:MAG: hypothetical protein RLZZ480_476 [Candidatus Parcubacteria bacterium]|jgi:uncharacterized membrane protein